MWIKVKINIYFIFIIIRLCNSCDCDSEENVVIHKNTNQNKILYENIKQKPTEEIASKKDAEEDKKLLYNEEDLKENVVTVKYDNKNKMLEENTKQKSMEAITAKTDIEQDSNLIYNEEDFYETSCPHFKKVSSSNYGEIADVWQTSFYKTSEPVACFKMFIKRLTQEDQKYRQLIYGDMNGTLDWKNSIFELHFNDRHFQTKQFLFDDGNDFGVFDNILISEQNDGNETKIYINEESPDQWMVEGNLLLIRDCDTGEVVVFSRVPFSPKLEKIQQALQFFGEYDSDGDFACVDETEKNLHSTKKPENYVYVRSIKNILRDVYNKLVSIT